MKKFELGSISEVFVSKIKGGYHVSVCGEFEGQPYGEIDSIDISNGEVSEQIDYLQRVEENYDMDSYDKYEVAARLGFRQLEFSEEY